MPPTPPTDRYSESIRLIDAANAEDPRLDRVDGEDWPRELLYAHRMTDRLEQFAPDASEPLRLAARAQHIRRWEIPRDNYPRDRKGYHEWRTRLYSHHADCAEQILRQVGYDDATIDRVRSLLMKKQIKSDPEMQTLEDVICLVFLDHYFADFVAEKDYDDDKLVRILQRTWRKMSEPGHAAALQLDLPDKAKRLIEKALT